MLTKSYIHPKAKKGLPSKIHGNGLFALGKIKKGEIVAIKSGHLVEIKEKKELAKIFGQSFLQITNNFFIGPKNKAEVGQSFIYYNHSCEPNMGVQGQIIFVALKDIKPGEEITVDYATTENDNYNFNCDCGGKSCRKIITGKDWKNKYLQDKYKNYFSWYLFNKTGL